MEQRIRDSLTRPEYLEHLYNENKKQFKESFAKVIIHQPSTELIRFWQTRLLFAQEQIEKYSNLKLNLIPLFISIIFVAFFIRLADIFSFTPVASEMYQFRNPAIIVFLGLTIYGLLVNERRDLTVTLGFVLVYILLALQLNSLPQFSRNQILPLAIIHSPIICWFLYGMAINSKGINNREYWMKFLRYNGDLIVFSGLILICWLIIFGVTTYLLDTLDYKYSMLFLEKLLVVAAAVTPLIACFATERMPILGNKIVPLIARIFNPIVLIVLVIYMIIFVEAGRNLFSEREFLMLFNVILFSVLAIILFSLSNIAERGTDKYRLLILYLLTLFSCSLNLIGLSAIIYRLINYGLTPNRVALVAMNLLVFGNLIKIGIDLLLVHSGKKSLEKVSLGIAGYLPLYGIWALAVVVLFPLIFPSWL